MQLRVGLKFNRSGGKAEAGVFHVEHLPGAQTVPGGPWDSGGIGVFAARREAAAYLELDEDRLQIICPPGPTGRRPPYLYLDGRPMAECGLSISHDGDWIAWAVAGAVREDAAGS